MKTKLFLFAVLLIALAVFVTPANADDGRVPWIECVVIVGVSDVPMYPTPDTIGASAWITNGTKLLGSRHPEVATAIVPGYMMVAYNGLTGYVKTTNVALCPYL
jgi:hypothetical protein